MSQKAHADAPRQSPAQTRPEPVALGSQRMPPSADQALARALDRNTEEFRRSTRQGRGE